MFRGRISLELLMGYRCLSAWVKSLHVANCASRVSFCPSVGANRRRVNRIFWSLRRRHFEPLGLWNSEIFFVVAIG
jgi:hypothetical protein